MNEGEKFLKYYGIKEYIIIKSENDINGYVVDVNQDVKINHDRLEKVPVKFNIVKGNFDCSYNKLTNLNFCPKKVYGDFLCDENKLTSLIGCPEDVKGTFNCGYNDLNNLNGIQKIIYQDLICNHNLLKNLIGFPNEILGNLNLSYNPFEYENFKDVIIKVNGEIDIPEKNSLIKNTKFYKTWLLNKNLQKDVKFHKDYINKKI